MRDGDRPGDREPQPGPGAAPRRVEPREPLEHPRLGARWEPGAAIRDAQDRVGGLGPDVDQDLAGAVPDRRSRPGSRRAGRARRGPRPRPRRRARRRGRRGPRAGSAAPPRRRGPRGRPARALPGAPRRSGRGAAARRRGRPSARTRRSRRRAPRRGPRAWPPAARAGTRRWSGSWSAASAARASVGDEPALGLERLAETRLRGREPFEHRVEARRQGPDLVAARRRRQAASTGRRSWRSRRLAADRATSGRMARPVTSQDTIPTTITVTTSAINRNARNAATCCDEDPRRLAGDGDAAGVAGAERDGREPQARPRRAFVVAAWTRRSRAPRASRRPGPAPALPSTVAVA